MATTMALATTTLVQKLTENRGYATPQFLAVLEPMLGLERTTKPAFERVGWNDGTLMGVPQGGLTYDAFIGWCSVEDFERNLRGIVAYVGGIPEEAEFLVAHCLGLPAC